MSSVPVVGQIFNPPGYLPPFTQPGGIGSPVYPAQSSGELATSQWIMNYCNHGCNNFLVQAATLNGQQVALILCPLCQTISQIISPFSAIYSFPFEILFP
jgi:hypothetical protein